MARGPHRAVSPWLIGVAGLTVALAVQLFVVRPLIETDLTTTTTTVLRQDGYDDVRVSVSGRDVEIRGPLPERDLERIRERLATLPGVRTVTVTQVGEAGSPVATRSGPPQSAAGTPNGSRTPSSDADTPSNDPSAPTTPPVAIADLASLGAVVDGDSVVLVGSTPSARDHRALVAAVRTVLPEHEVTDRVGVDPEAGGHDLDRFTALVGELAQRSRSAAVSLHIGRVVVAGAVAQPDRAGLRRAALAAADDDPDAVDLRVSDPAAGPSDEQVAAQLAALPAITFSARRSTPAEGTAGILRTAADLLEQHPGIDVRVEGHTDARGNLEGNLALSQERADVVATRLRRNGVPADRISTRGFGSQRPLVTGRGERADAVNRRVVLVGVVG